MVLHPPTISGNEIGDLFFDTDLEILLYWDGTEWVPVAGQDQWVVDRVSAGSTPVITPQDQNTDIGCGGTSRTDPDASLSTDGRVFLRRTDGTDDPKIVMATDNGRVGLVEFTSDGPGSQRKSQWEFKDSSSSPGGDDGQVVIKAQGGIDIRATGADDACINVDPQRSRDWGTSEDDDDAIRVRNFSVNVFEAGDMGAVTARKSFTVGSVGTGGENIPGFFKGIGNDTHSGVETDTAFELEFSGNQVFRIDYRGKATGALTEGTDPDNTLVTKDYVDANTGGSGEVPSGGTDDRPTSPGIGDLYFDTDLELLLVWNGTEWQPATDGLWIEDSGKLYPTTLTNNVGIGTDAPAEKLHVNGKVRANDYDLEALPPLSSAP